MAERGRPSRYSEELNQAAKDYIENFNTEHGHVIPSVVGMAVAINIGKSTLYEWARDKKGDFSETLARCKDNQEVQLLNKGLTSEFNPTIVKLALANHGYSDKTENTISGPNGGPIELAEMSNDQLNAKLQELLYATEQS